MTAIERLRAIHARADVADRLRDAARGLADVLTSDDIFGVDLYDAIEAGLLGLLDALDADEDQARDAVRLPAPEPGPIAEQGEDRVRCEFSEEPIVTCACRTCRAHRGEDVIEIIDDTPDAEDDEVDDDASDERLRNCVTCHKGKPDDQFSSWGRGVSKSCAPCVSERQRQVRQRARESADAKEPV